MVPKKPASPSTDASRSLLFSDTCMRINLKKFGTLLVSRSNDREALLAFRPTLNALPSTETYGAPAIFNTVT